MPPPAISFVPPVAKYIRSTPGRRRAPPRYTQHARTPNRRTLRAPSGHAPCVVHVIGVRHGDTTGVDAALREATPRPQVLVLELCMRRVSLLDDALSADDASSPATTRAHGNSGGCFQRCLETWLDWQTTRLERALNGSSSSSPRRAAEMRRAVQTFRQLHVRGRVVLGDRRVEDTMLYWAQRARLAEKLTLALDVALMPLMDVLQTPLEQRLADDGALQEWRRLLSVRAPAAFRALCELRELHMVWALRDSAACMNAECVALVCGAAHCDAVVQLLERGDAVPVSQLQHM